MEDLFKNANLMKDDYMVLVEGKKSEPCNVSLRVAIMKGWEVKIVKKPDGFHDFGFSGRALCYASREELMKKMCEYDLYTNWFAMSLYDCTKFENGLFKLVKQVQQILKSVPNTAELRSKQCEFTYASLLSEAFDHFMRKDDHQCSMYNGSLPNFFMAPLNNALPQHPKLIAYFKIDEFEEAKAQSLDYSMAMVDQTDANYPILAHLRSLRCICAFWNHMNKWHTSRLWKLKLMIQKSWHSSFAK